MATPPILYSANTWLAFMISERYYRSKHYVWCSPCFDASAKSSLEFAIPPSSSPAEIYRELQQAVMRGDQHSRKIELNRAGLLRGVKARQKSGDIDKHTLEEVTAVINTTGLSNFRPLMYLIPYDRVSLSVLPVPVASRAHPLSVEYVIPRLSRDDFDVIEY